MQCSWLGERVATANVAKVGVCPAWKWSSQRCVAHIQAHQPAAQRGQGGCLPRLEMVQPTLCRSHPGSPICCPTRSRWWRTCCATRRRAAGGPTLSSASRKRCVLARLDTNTVRTAHTLVQARQSNPLSNCPFPASLRRAARGPFGRRWRRCCRRRSSATARPSRAWTPPPKWSRSRSVVFFFFRAAWPCCVLCAVCCVLCAAVFERGGF